MGKKTPDVYIPAFYAGRSIFITGGTGFIGKVLIEKLLRSCPDVAEIFILIRPKKGLNVNDRFKKMLDNKVRSEYMHLEYIYLRNQQKYY